MLVFHSGLTLIRAGCYEGKLAHVLGVPQQWLVPFLFFHYVVTQPGDSVILFGTCNH
jgi:hypothetical protein